LWAEDLSGLLVKTLGLCNRRVIGDNLDVRTTRDFVEQVLRKRSYLRREWCERVMAKPLRVEVQPDGRVRYWGVVPELGARVLRVITLEDGETVHNAFPDRDFEL
jgi:hypothetical protein